MENTFLSVKNVCLFTLLLFCSNLSFAQLPQCDRIYMDQYDQTLTSTQKIYNYNPTLPVSATNPSLNAITLPLGADGLTVGEVLGTTSPTLTFYTVVNQTYWYYNPTTSVWVNTNHNTGSAGAVNIASGGGFIFNLDGNAGEVYRYDGTGNGALLVAIPDFINEGPYDLIADCAGNFYLLNATGNGTTPYLRKYSSSGVLLQSWTVSNPNNYAPAGGFGIIGPVIYMDDIDLFSFTLNGIVSGNIGASTANLASVSATLPPYNNAIAGDLGSCASGVPVMPDITITASATTVLAGSSVTFTSAINAGGPVPQYQWVVNGVDVSGATNPTFTYVPNPGDIVTCKLISSLSCVININATSNAITINVEDCVPPTLSFEPSEFCRNTGSATPVFSPAGGAFSASPAGAFINNTSGMVNLNTINEGSYIITYTIPPTTLCPALSIKDTILVHPSPSPEIKMITDGGKLCQNDTVKVRTTNIPDYLYKWWPESAFPYGTKESEVINKLIPGYIYVSVTNKEGCTAIDSLDVRPEHCCNVMVPNAFSPNGDAVNDVFTFYTNTAQDVNQLSIYNRWGERVYYTNNQKVGWNGEHNNKPADAGVYYYYLSYYCSDGKEIIKKGELLLIR